MQRGLPPILNSRARVLILGSFPSVKSLAALEYYAHPQNQFWKILLTIAGKTGVNASHTYAARKQIALGMGVGIWDVVDACEREGSGDERIENALLNDFSVLSKRAPGLSRVCFNGQAAAKLGHAAFAGLHYETVVLPSTSPRNARMPLLEKTRIWKEAVLPGGSTA